MAIINDPENFSSSDSTGTAALTPPESKYTINLTLAASTARTVTWPTGYNFCNISGTYDYWTNASAVATIPSADELTGVGSVYNRGPRKKASPTATGFSIISASAQTLSIEFWK